MPKRSAREVPMPMLSRRDLGLGLAAGACLLAAPRFASAAPIGAVGRLPGEAVPIGRAERLARVAKAQRLMRDLGLGAILVEPGASLTYFTGVRWGRSERLTAALIPAEGETIIVTPFFEEPSVRESLAIPAQVRTWQEDEDPLRLVADALRGRRVAGRPVGIEETVRFFAVDGLRKHGVPLATGAPVVRGCRMFKS